MKSHSPAQKRYNRRVVFLSLFYAMFLLAAVYLFKHHLIDGPVAYLVAILPALPIVGIFAAIGGYFVEESDEYLRMMMIRQTLYASGFALSVATIWGFLESFDLIGHPPSYDVAILWFFGLGLGGCINKFTEGRGE